MSNITPLQYAQALYDAVSETNPKDHDKVIDNFERILVERGNLELHSDIEEEFHKLAQKSKEMQKVEVTFAHEHNPKILNDLNAILQGEAKFKMNIDAGIIGGIIVRIEDTLIDASVKTQLENLNKLLKK